MIFYWRRTEPDGSNVYFTTNTQEEHERAEEDERSVCVTKKEFDDKQVKVQDTAAELSTAYCVVRDAVTKNRLRNSDRVAILELIKHELLTDMLHIMRN